MPHDIRRPHTITWHSLSAEETLDRLDSAASGLSAAEAAERLRQVGPNLLPKAERRPAWKRLAAQFSNVLIVVLLVAGVVTLALEHYVDSGVIFGVVLVNALIGFIQEGKAEQALESIKKMLSPEAVVLRDGRRVQVKAEDIVPGDVVIIEPGDRIPGDLRIIKARGLRIQEAVLTGESVPVDKTAAPAPPDAPLAERVSLAFAGTTTVQGYARGVVYGTGLNTEIGRISEMLGQVETLNTPLLRALERFGRILTVAILALAAVAFAVGVFLRGYTAEDMFLSSIGLAVAAIPEGLPAIVTITLAIGVSRMANPERHHPALAGCGDTGRRLDHMHRQDRHAHAQRDDHPRLCTGRWRGGGHGHGLRSRGNLQAGR